MGSAETSKAGSHDDSAAADIALAVSDGWVGGKRKNHDRFRHTRHTYIRDPVG